MTAAEVLSQAQAVADDILFPAAENVDAADRVPASHFEALATAGLYGLAGPVEAGGLDADLVTFCRVIEIMSAGCLATAFVWLQHHSAVRTLAASANDRLRADWLPSLCQGRQRAGVALGGARPGPPLLRARFVAGGYRLDGTAPWVTGWDLVDVIHTVARDDNGDLVMALLPAIATAGGTLTADRLELAAVQASRTVELRFAGHFVPADLVIGTTSQADWAGRDAAGLRPNGSLALGVARRCGQLIGQLGGPEPELAAELTRRRAALDAAGPAGLPEARAAASAFAYQAAGLLAATAGSRSILVGQHPQRLAREALFLLVFGSRPAIKQSLLARLAGLAPDS